MTTTAELVRGNASQIPAYVAKLEQLITEQAAGNATPGIGPRHAEPPLPGNAPAFGALMVIWEAVFRIEEFLRDEDAEPWDGYDLADYPRQRRGGSAGNFLAALDAIPKLAAGRSEDMEAWCARALERCNDLARHHPDIDEAQQWRHMRGRPCPYCGCFFLKVLLDSAGRATGHVECFTVRCADGNGQRPVAGMGTDERGRPVLAWADGMIETVPDMEDD